MTPPAQKRRALGKGIDVLFPGKDAEGPRPVLPTADLRRGILKVAIEDIASNRSQPRKSFDDESLDQLAQSIREQGLMQPILVRKKTSGYEIIAGERRWRACQKAGLKTVDVIVKDLSDPESFVWALIENIQREDLNPIEQAMAFKQIIEENHFTQEQLSEKIGKDRSTIANALRLLRLPNEVRRQVVAGALSMGHARALLALDDDEHMVKEAREILKRGLSVREVERRVKALRDKAEPAEKVAALDPYEAIPGGKGAVLRETEALTKRYGTRVRIQVSGRRGRVEIDFASPDELERVLSLLKGD